MQGGPGTKAKVVEDRERFCHKGLIISKTVMRHNIHINQQFTSNNKILPVRVREHFDKDKRAQREEDNFGQVVVDL